VLTALLAPTFEAQVAPYLDQQGSYADQSSQNDKRRNESRRDKSVHAFGSTANCEDATVRNRAQIKMRTQRR